MNVPITADTLLLLHERSLREHGGAPGVKDDPAACIGAATNACLYRADGWDPLVFAVSLFWCLARGHKFVDGNKRVAWASLCLVLALDGLSVDASDDDAEAFVLGVASGELDVRAVEAWIVRRLSAGGAERP